MKSILVAAMLLTGCVTTPVLKLKTCEQWTLDMMAGCQPVNIGTHDVGGEIPALQITALCVKDNNVQTMHLLLVAESVPDVRANPGVTEGPVCLEQGIRIRTFSKREAVAVGTPTATQ